jgi:pilus assembly protein CpaC
MTFPFYAQTSMQRLATAEHRFGAWTALALACLLSTGSALAQERATEQPKSIIPANAEAGRGFINPEVLSTVPPASPTANKSAAARAAAAAAAARPAVVETGPRRVLAVGDVSVIGLPGVARIALGNGGLVKATVVDDREIVLLAESAGETTMHVWLKNGRQLAYDLVVRANRSERVLEDLQTLIKDEPGVHARQVGERLVLEGRYSNTEAATRIRTLASSFPQVLNLIPDKPADADPLQMERMVQIDMRVVEVKKRMLDQLGIKWASSANGPVFATNILGYSNTPFRPIYDSVTPLAPVTTAHPVAAFLGMASQIASSINLLEQQGDAWTLAEPRLSCRSGGESKFIAGGEIPIPVAVGAGAISVVYKEYGVRVEFKPVADGQGNVESSIMVEVSEPDARNSNQGFIAFTTNRAETQVSLKEGEPLIIAGLFREKFDKSSDSVPGLSKLSWLSYLFGSKEKRAEQTELLIVAVPRVITPDSALNKADVRRAIEIKQETSAQINDRMESTTPTSGQLRQQ